MPLTNDTIVETLLVLAERLASPESLGDRLDFVCRSCASLLECDRSSLFLLEDGFYRARHNWGNPPDVAEVFLRFRVSQKDPLIARAMETRGAVTINDALNAPLMNTVTAESARIRAIIVVPLFEDGDHPLGFLTAEFNETPGTFSPIQGALLLGLGRIAQIAILAERGHEARRRAEEDLRASEQRYRCLAEELEDRVRARTGELEEAQRDLERSNLELSTINRQFEAGHRALDAFAGAISHDLRAPLRYLNGLAYLLLDRPGVAGDPEATSGLQSIRASALRMAERVEALLLFARHTGKELKTGPVELAPLVAEARQLCCELRPGSNVQCHIGPLPVVHADAALLRVVFDNLLDNAWKFSERRPSPRIEIGVVEEIEAEVVIAIRDNGVGFDSRNAWRLFDVFQRFHSNEEFPGSGVGLATAARILEKHQGRIWAESTPGEGATFYVALPRAST